MTNSNTSRPITVTPSTGIWREHDINVTLETSPGMTNVLNISRNELIALRSDIDRYLENHNDQSQH